ncbi:uncharacterized protein RCC_12273 [Ramularia collo-cygni]|uniref:Transposase IS30-like HTH domain-containing protein n=1 Tax=Ramularia collo-cygni TaxID=112498 RepID=A0A2D3UNH1_9PEZI|nr:uncharacterized protein RCC_12273 [Ramularia collo-cygni]CZT14968.1 uncharacterized protein RCC_12273 [Ramularia collo-cygni]
MTCRAQVDGNAQLTRHVRQLHGDGWVFNKNEKHYYSVEEDARIVELRQKGVSYSEIGRVLGRSSSGVERRFHDYLLANPTSSQSEPSAIEQRIVEGLQARKPLSAVARELDLSRKTAWRRLNAVCPGNDPSAGLNYSSWTEEKGRVVQRALAEGKSITQVALEMGLTYQSVYNFARRTKLITGGRKYTRPSRIEPDGLECLEESVKDEQSTISGNDLDANRGGESTTSTAHQGNLSEPDSSPAPQKMVTIRDRIRLAEREELVRRYDQGQSRRELTTYLQRPSSTVDRVLREELKKLGRRSVINTPWSTEEDKKIRSYRSQGISCPQMAKVVPGRTVSSIRSRLAKLEKESSLQTSQIPPV